MYLPRDRVVRLIELSALERTLTGPERLLREEDVALLVKAAYDDATEEARAAFMAKVKDVPTSLWPWSAVRATAPRGGGGVVVANPMPPVVPAALVLLLGQVDSPEGDPGNRIPDRNTPGAAEWEPLYKALETWDTKTIQKWVGPQAWITPGGTTAGQVPKETGTGGPPQNGNGTPPGGNGTNGNGTNGGQPPSASAFSWRHPAVIAVGATVATTVAFSLYAIHRSRTQPAAALTTPRQETP